ncbi:MAG: C25 family cysteine peptidase, partial [Petrotogales bacterium]
WNHLDKSFNADEDYSWGERGDDGFDLYAELFLGRIPCDEPQDVSNWMTKSFYYTDSSEVDYLENAAFFGGDTTWYCQGDDFIDFSAIKGTDDWLGPYPDPDYPDWAGFMYGFETWNKVNPGVPFNLSVAWTQEPPNPGWKGGSSSGAIAGFREAINNDQVTIISGIAHANSYMSLDVYDYEWESNYHNTKPFFIHDYGCHCGDIDTDDGVLHSMLFHSDTELAFGCVYNTGYGWGNSDCTNSSSAFQAKVFWDYFLDMANNSGDPSNWQLGKAHAWSKDVMAPTIDWDYQYGTWRGIIQSCLLFADPYQQLKPPNLPPEKPDQPYGPTEGITDIEYNFSSSTTDQEGDQIYYKFDWGDNKSTNWLGPHDSGATAEASHAWTEAGDYEIRVKAKDVKGGESVWSEPSSIHILQAPILDIGLISGGLFKISAVIENKGELEATDLEWSITLDGGVWIGKETTGTLSIAPGDEETITSGPIIGFGKTEITVSAEVPESFDTRSQGGKILLFFVYVNPGG